MNTKVCSKCDQGLAIEEFGLSPRRRDGVLVPRARCKSCERVAAAKWRTRNPEKVVARNARYYAENREAELARNRAKHRDWAPKNASRRTGEPSNWDKAMLLRRDGADCHLCERPIALESVWPHPLSITVDHVVPLCLGGSNDAGNVRLAHRRCNERKKRKLWKAA